MLLHLANRDSFIPTLDATNSHLAHHLTGTLGIPSLGAGQPFTATPIWLSITFLAMEHGFTSGRHIQIPSIYMDKGKHGLL